MSETKVTIVYKWIQDAINAKNPDGTRKYKYIINEGSSRSSKTQSIIQTVHKYCSENNGKRSVVWRDTKSDCLATVGYDVFKIFRQLPNYDFISHVKTLDYKKIDSYKFWTKSAFELNGSDDEDKVIGFQGDVSWFNEPYKIGKATFDQIDMRTSDFIIIDWNPKKSHWIEDLKKDPRAIVIHSTFKHNPFCPKEQKIKILGYQPVSMSSAVKDKKITEIEAFDYDISKNERQLTQKEIEELTRCILNEEKSSANEFNWKVYGLGLKADKPNKIYNNWKVIQDIEFDKLDVECYYGVDWGAVDPFAVVAVKYYDGQLYLKELNYDSENEIKAKLSVEFINKIKDSEEGIVTWLFNKLALNKENYFICDNNRPQKVLSLRKLGYEYALTASKPKGSINDGIDIIQNLNVNYTQSSKNLEHEYENYQRKEDRMGVLTEQPLDADNHLMDAIRYVVNYLKMLGVINKI